MDAVSALLDDLARRGGTAAAATLVRVAGRGALQRAVAGGEVERLGWGVYALASAPPALRAAAAVRGTVSHASAAQLWMVDPLHRPARISVTVPRAARRRRPLPGTRLHWSDLAPADVDGPVTAPLRTALDCARSMPFEEALGVADGFLRRRLVDPGELRAAAAALRGAGRARAVAVASAADSRSDNPFESALRAVVLRCGAGAFVPQVVVDAGPLGRVRPDLVDEGRRVVLEADSFAWHGSRAALARDCERYDALVVSGYLVLRFSWEQVVGAPEQVAEAVRRVVALVDEGRAPQGDLQNYVHTAGRGR
ncbi:DUF559 domain-containing protein [uncultured Pseudokineococcus sp.]|uniref:DUF559 domain-containing protein n=1 Tax=uncultured Pseudokineococcus sp. TaxID=1642928 RepID=UPI00262F3518|nr:DUF559 domain-containing protein [uncultured Pseudokineococcus sp.]